MLPANPRADDDGGYDVPLGGKATVCSSDEHSKKTRKPYIITKSRENWTDPEHDKFIEALHLFDRDWKKIKAFVGSKTVIQIRSHAQKYFLKVQKNGASEHVPPPRPKRKAAHPYPQKATKNGYPLRTDSSSVLKNSGTSEAALLWARSSVQPVGPSQMSEDYTRPAGAMMANNGFSSSTESSPRVWPTCETTDRGNLVPSLRVMPDFTQIYSFIGNVFDPSSSGHLEKLREMDPIDVETVLLLMRNLSVNLTNPDFEDHRRLLSSYDLDSEEAKPRSGSNALEACETMKSSFLVKGK